MRKLILFMVMSLDGFVCGSTNGLDWEEQEAAVGEYLVPRLMERSDTLLLGRVLYQGFAGAWAPLARDSNAPDELVAFAKWIETTPKIVFSNTLTEVPWNESRIVTAEKDEDIRDEVQRLKALPGKNLLVFGGAQLAQTLINLDLVDEIQLKIQPVALGQGKALFGALTERLPLKLIESKAFSSGVIAATYIRQSPSNEV